MNTSSADNSKSKSTIIFICLIVALPLTLLGLIKLFPPQQSASPKTAVVKEATPKKSLAERRAERKEARQQKSSQTKSTGPVMMNAVGGFGPGMPAPGMGPGADFGAGFGPGMGPGADFGGFGPGMGGFDNGMAMGPGGFGGGFGPAALAAASVPA